jgi:hypothetical protein
MKIVNLCDRWCKPVLGGYYKLHQIPAGYQSRYWELWLSKHSTTGFWYIKLWVSKNQISGSYIWLRLCQVLQECQLITQKAAGSFMIPGGSLRVFQITGNGGSLIFWIQVPGTGGSLILIFPSTGNRWLLEKLYPPPNADYCPSRK